MPSDYKTVTDRVIAVLEAERTDALSDGLSGNVSAVNKGQYTPAPTASKPIVYVRVRRAGLIADMAGGLSRTERLLFIVSGAASGTTQGAAWDDAMTLLNNVQNVLAHYPSDGSNWYGSRCGWGYSDADEAAETFAEMEADPGSDGCAVHFQLLWSCDCRIAREDL